ncbi:hypothetical protein KOW79_020576 [Hemibagrus wyckioides]|uniref:Uncharacterized protein n=1 Tax=Hemibagrus wyckioides TaxID=337641 RepID=A0A9D3S9U1_9TELE|nr:hypothetical protein KOW79_020576 [Hemibagrus wyckioides]
MEKKKNAKDLKHFQELYEMEQTMLKQKKQEEKRKNRKAFKVITSQTWGQQVENVQKLIKSWKQKEKQESAETLEANKAADLLYHQTQKIKAQKKKEAVKLLQDSYVHQMNEKHAKKQLREKQKQECKVRNAQLIAEEEKQFQTYAKDVIETARKGQRNTSILYKASKVGM